MNGNETSRIVIVDSRLMLKIVASITDNSRGIIYNCNMCIEQAADMCDRC